VRRLVPLLLLTAASLHRLAAQEARAMRMQHDTSLVVNTAWLAAHLDSANVLVIHVGRDDSLYRLAHVPGAWFLPLSLVATTVNGVPNEFPDVRHLGAAFVHQHIGDSTRVVLYGDDPGLMAARAWAALDLVGHGGHSALLDGGLTRWRAEGRAVDTGLVAAPRPPVLIHGHWQADRIVDAEWVRAHLGDSTVLFVDSRSAEQFAGAEPPCPPAMPDCPQIPAERRGHLPGAKNIHWMDALVSREDPVLKPLHDLHHGLWMAAGADQSSVRTIVVYCRTGMQASFDYFVARYLGYPDVRLYDGSFIEWAGLPADTHPIEAGAGR
jgi:thiosulfate/3-mercaptopyruvate sulfurtransferase